MMMNTCHAKSDKMSEKLKTEGNNFYKERKFIEAALKYNASLCYGSEKSENLGFSYANRSAVCFELKRFSDCMRNIKLARENNYPSENFHILKVREEKCEKHKRKIEKDSKWDFFKLSFKARKSNPQFCEILELNSSEKFGRFITTKEDIRAGSVLAIEKPAFSVLLSQSNHVEVDSQNKFSRCSFCLRENIFCLIPCSGCNCAMFCPECIDEAQKLFHNYECPIMEFLTQGSVHIALRIFFIALSAFDGSIEKLKSFMKQIDADDKNYSIFDFDTSNFNVKNYLRFFNSLSRSKKQFAVDQHMTLLRKLSNMRDLLENHESFVREFLLKVCQTNDHYFHGIYGAKVRERDSNTLDNLQAPIGSGWFGFSCLINHSCCSNVMRIYVDGKLVLIASRFIPKGAQLFDCYKVSFTKHSKAERQLRLQQEFGFKCECEACSTDDFKMPLSIKNLALAKYAAKIEKQISSIHTHGASIKLFKEICEFMNENYPDFPSLELILLQKHFAFLLLLSAK